VPALIAVQRDVSRPLTALRRASSARARGVTWPVALATPLLALWLGLTMLWPALTGALPAPLATALPEALAAASPAGAGLALFLAGALGLVLAVYLLAALVLALSSRRRARMG